MAEIYKFFNSAPGDPRTYQAADFADYFGSVLSTGFLHTDNVPGMAVRVVAGTLQTVVSPGKAIMRGHLYENTTDLTLTHAIPEPTLDRIDRIVLRLDLRNSERNIKLHVKAGVAAATPVAPTLQRDNFIYELSLARVLVRRNTVQLLAGDLVDERLVESVGGLVHSLISIPTEQFQRQWDEFMAGIQDEGFASQAELNTHKADDATGAHKASNISFAPPAGMTATDVQQAISQTFQQANDIKTKWASVVGSPLLSTDTQAQMQTKTQTIKNTLATNLTNKGQSATGSETLTSLVNKVANVNTGKRWASGTTTTTGGGQLSVTGLPFTPTSLFYYANSNYAGASTKFFGNLIGFRIVGGNYMIHNSTFGASNISAYTEVGNSPVQWIAYE